MGRNGGEIRQQEFVAIAKAENCDIQGIMRCEWCNIWKPDRDMLPGTTFANNSLFGVKTCTNCYYNFMKMTAKLETCQKLSLWVTARLLKIARV